MKKNLGGFTIKPIFGTIIGIGIGYTDGVLVIILPFFVIEIEHS